MAVKRFLLDTSQLDDTTYGLDGISPPFIIDTSVLDGNGLLDGAEFLTTATGTATLGSMSASATSSVTNLVSATAELGAMSATATSTVTHSVTATATLGELSSTATATVALPATASATFGSLVASAVTAVEQEAVAVASLGGLVATVDSAPTPPEPEPTPAPSGGRRVYSTTPRKKIEPLVEMPPVEIPVIEPKKRYAVSSTVLGGMSSQAATQITFSILDDEAELLLML